MSHKEIIRNQLYDLAWSTHIITLSNKLNRTSHLSKKSNYCQIL